MTSVVIVADRGAEMARLTASIHAIPGMEIVRHASGRTGVAGVVARCGPTLVVVGELSPRRLTFERVSEIRAACPRSVVVVIAATAGARWLAEALQAGATAGLPRETGPAALKALVAEALTHEQAGAADVALAA